MDTDEMDDKIRSLFSEWKSLQPLKGRGLDDFKKKIRLEWNYHSNKIEGNTLTYGETELLLIFGRMDGGHTERNYMEMKAHDVAIAKVQQMAKEAERPLTEADIRELNKITLKEPFYKSAQTPEGDKTQKKIEPGKYKSSPNHVKTAAGEVFKFAEPNEVPAKMEELTKRINREIESPSHSIVSFLSRLHHDFLSIHPFDDGNGRVGRMLLNYVLLKLGYPPMVIKSTERENYLTALAKADSGSITSLERLLRQALISWLEIGIRAARGEDIRELEDVDKEAELFIKSKTNILTINDIDKKKVLYDDFLAPLIGLFQKKLHPFEKLFQSNEVFINGKKSGGLGEITENIDLVIANASLFSKPPYIRINFGEYRHLKRPFGVGVILSINLEELEYEAKMEVVQMDTLRSSGSNGEKSEMRYENIIKKQYGDIWTESEIKGMVRKIKESILDTLKEMDGKHNETK